MSGFKVLPFGLKRREGLGDNPASGGGNVRPVAQPTPAGPDCAALLKRVADGDQAAMGELYDATSRMVFGLALRIVGESADAEEVTLDVYTQAWRQANRYDASRGEAVTWLLTLARSRAIDKLRSRGSVRKREQDLESAFGLASEGPDPEGQSAVAQRATIVRKALDKLSAEQREVIELAFFEGLTHVEIAAQIRQPLGTAKSRIRLGMAKLRDALAPLEEGWST